MRDPDRIKRILDKIEKVWRQTPDLRFGQLMYSLECEAKFYLEDDSFEKILDERLKQDDNKRI